jgi:hypothetical protein
LMVVSLSVSRMMKAKIEGSRDEVQPVAETTILYTF